MTGSESPSALPQPADGNGGSLPGGMDSEGAGRWDSGSFRDRASRVFRREGEVFRSLSAEGLSDWERLRASDWFEALQAAGKVVRTWRVDDARRAELEQRRAGESASAPVEPTAIEPVVTELRAIESLTGEPATTQLRAIESPTVEPPATQLRAIEPPAIELAAIESPAAESPAMEHRPPSPRPEIPHEHFTLSKGRELAGAFPSSPGRGTGGEGSKSRTRRPLGRCAPLPHPKSLSRGERGFTSLQHEMGQDDPRMGRGDPPAIEPRWAATLAHETIPFVSYPYEWPFGMLRDAALLHLEVLEAALGGGMILKDGSSYNVQWTGTRPVFVDVGSFTAPRPGEPWAGYRQFCRHFLFPLLLQAYKDVPFQPWLRGSLEGIQAGDMARLMSARDLLRPGVFTHVWLQAKAEARYGESAARSRGRRVDKPGEVRPALRGAGFDEPGEVRAALRGAGFDKPGEVRAALRGAGFDKPGEVRAALRGAGFDKPGEVRAALRGAGFDKPGEVRAALRGAGFDKPGEVRAALRGAGFDKPGEVRAALRGAGFHAGLIRANVRRLKRLVGGLGSAPTRSRWTDYAHALPYTETERAEKAAFVRQVVHARDRTMVWDLGCNTGAFARIAAERAGTVVAMDSDPRVVEALYQALKEEGASGILPLVGDVADPSPNRGWRGAERRSPERRGSPELVLVLALVHHLVVGASIPLPEVTAWLASFGAAVIVEFVDREDPMVRALLDAKDERYDDYDRRVFERCLSEAFETKARKVLSSGTRILYYAEPKAWG